MLDQLTSAQLSEWIAYHDLDPIGEWRDDFRFAKLEARLVNITREIYQQKGKPPEMILPIDLMPDWTNDKVQKQVIKKQTVDQHRDILMSLVKSQNKRMEKIHETALPKVKSIPPSYRKKG